MKSKKIITIMISFFMMSYYLLTPINELAFANNNFLTLNSAIGSAVSINNTTGSSINTTTGSSVNINKSYTI